MLKTTLTICLLAGLYMGVKGYVDTKENPAPQVQAVASVSADSFVMTREVDDAPIVFYRRK